MPLTGLADLTDPPAAGDVTIVGAGAVGLFLASALAERGLRVTVLEGGPAIPPADYRSVNRGRNMGRHHVGLAEGRMQALGGTTKLWGGQLVPFDAGDFAAIDEDGARLWPITHEEFAVWLAGTLRRLGLPPDTFGPARAFGDEGLELIETVWLRQPDFTRLFAETIHRNSQVSVIHDAPVTGMTFAADGSIARLRCGASGPEIAPRQVVLAGGTFGTLALLLAAAGTEGCPFAGNRFIGRYFLDHLHGLVGRVETDDPGALARRFAGERRGGIKQTVKAHATRPPNGPNVALTLNPAVGLRELVGGTFDILRRAVTLRGSPKAALQQSAATLRVLAPALWGYLIQRRSVLPLDRSVGLGVELELLPRAESRVTLDEDGEVRLDWRIGGGEATQLREAALTLGRALEAEGLGRVELDPRLHDADPAILTDMIDANHQMGGARMAASPDRGVVDPDLRVFGAANLSVCGGAVFPTGSFANSTLTALVLAERLADRLAREAQA